MQLTDVRPVLPTARGHNFTAKRYRGRLRVGPLETIDRSECVASPSAERVFCPTCEKLHGVAVDYDYQYRDDGTPFRVSRVGFCDGCSMVFWWDQSCDGSGAPFGRPIAGTLVTNDKQSVVEQVLKVYPQLRGVEQI